MKLSAICIAIVVSVLAPRSAFAGWGTSSWGMSPSDVMKSVTTGETLDDQSCPVPWNIRQHQKLVETTSESAGWKFSHEYWFGANGLAIVKTSPIDRPSGGRADALCEQRKAEITTIHGAPVQTKGTTTFDWTWEPAGTKDTIRLASTGDNCTMWVTSRAFASSGYASKTYAASCFDPVHIKGNNASDLDSMSGTCVSDKLQYFVARPLAIAETIDLQFELEIWKPGTLLIVDAAGKELTTMKTSPGQTKIDNNARARLTLEPGCYLVEVATEGEKVKARYGVDIAPYAEWKANDDLRSEEQLGEPGDEGPATAQYPAIITGTPPYRGGRVHLNTTGTIALVEAGTMYGTSTSVGIEVTRHPRARAIVGATASVMIQPTDDSFSTTNTMFPLGLWGGVRANATDRIFATARAGLLGYYITADADEMTLGGIDRSESGGGYLLGLDVAFGPAVVGVELWLLGESVTTFRLGFGF